MTNLEAIKANISDVHGVIFTENTFMKVLMDAGLDFGAQYTAASSRAIDLATIALYDMIIGGASFGESSLSYSQNVEGAKAAKATLEAKLGIGVSNVVRGKRVW